MTIEYASPDKILRKPLIVVEGFDPWKIIDPGNTSANYSFSDFISSNGVLGRGIYVPINYTHNGVFYSTLSDALEGEDFDLVFIDFDDGTDYIQRNAYLVENIIQWVNANKQPYAGVMQKNAVIGFSMGGLVARYALRDMELSSPVINHDTRLYMSFDSPHQGANIPLGFQATVSHLNGVGVGFGLPGIYYNPSSLQLGNLNPDLGRAFKLLNSPAARQMLYYSITGSGNLLINDNSAHTAFMADYTSKGYPLQGGIRNVVIANGSECGVDQGFQPHAQFVNFNKKISMKGFVKYVVAGLAGAVTNYPQALVQLIPGKSNIYMQFTINALPNQSNQRVYRGRVYIKKKILWLINSTVDIFDKSFNAPASYLPLDNYGGGVNDISSIAGSLPFPVNITRFSFVPTFSALDIGNGLQPITLNDLQRVYSPASPPAAPKNVIAANFFSNPSEQEGPANELHTQITLRNGRWMFEEIVGIPAFFSCSINCVGTGLESVISGASIICSSQVYKINNLPPGATVTWSSTWNSPPYPTLVHNSPNTNELTINNTYGYPSTTTLTATITGLCGSVVLTKQIMSETNTLVQHGNYTQQACYVNGLQQPALSGSLSTTGSATYLHQLCVAEITLTQMTGKTISVPYSQPMYWAYNSTNSKLTLQLPVGSGGVPFTFKISGEGACQEKTLVFFSYLTYYNKYAFSISPNPANSEYLTILAEPSEELLRQKSAQDASEGLEYTVSIIDLTTAETICSPVNFKGRLKQQLNITTLPQGLYNLRISAGDDTQTIRFLKQ